MCVPCRGDARPRHPRPYLRWEGPGAPAGRAGRAARAGTAGHGSATGRAAPAAARGGKGGGSGGGSASCRLQGESRGGAAVRRGSRRQDEPRGLGVLGRGRAPGRCSRKGGAPGIQRPGNREPR